MIHTSIKFKRSLFSSVVHTILLFPDLHHKQKIARDKIFIAGEKLPKILSNIGF